MVLGLATSQNHIIVSYTTHIMHIHWTTQHNIYFNLTLMYNFLVSNFHKILTSNFLNKYFIAKSIFWKKKITQISLKCCWILDFTSFWLDLFSGKFSQQCEFIKNWWQWSLEMGTFTTFSTWILVCGYFKLVFHISNRL